MIPIIIALLTGVYHVIFSVPRVPIVLETRVQNADQALRQISKKHLTPFLRVQHELCFVLLDIMAKCPLIHVSHATKAEWYVTKLPSMTAPTDLDLHIYTRMDLDNVSIDSFQFMDPLIVNHVIKGVIFARALPQLIARAVNLKPIYTLMVLVAAKRGTMIIRLEIQIQT